MLPAFLPEPAAHKEKTWMTRTLLLAPAVLACALLALPSVRAEGKIDEDAVPRIVCIAFTKAGDAASGKLEAAFLGKMRSTYAAQNVLFLQADVTTPATMQQARLLLNALSLNETWRKYAKKPGHVVLLDVDSGDERGTLGATAKEADAKKAFEAALKPPKDDDDEDEDKEDDGG
jgi:hypothetical protein